VSWRDPQVKKKSPEAPAGDRMSLVYDAAARGDYSAALEIWTPLAHAGVARAQSNIGACFSEGLGVVRDAKLAERWLQLAAEAGDPVGQRNLATLYFRGDGVDQDNARAAAFIAQPPNKAMSRCRTC
jgi:TPR repeat protein